MLFVVLDDLSDGGWEGQERVRAEYAGKVP